ncbi:DUF6414 family protein [Nocardioides sp. WG-D5]
MILREYLYVDTAAVRGALAQLDTGIVESETSKSANAKKTSIGVKGYLEHARDWGDDLTTTKTMGDAVFPLLEEGLTVHGLLEDVSDVVADPASWESFTMEDLLPAGKIVRITAPGYLFDARFVAGFIEGYAVTQRGLVNMGVFDGPNNAVVPPKAKKPAKKYEQLPGEDVSLEGRIPLGQMPTGEPGSDTGEFFRGVVQVARGVFAPGLHLMLMPDIDTAGPITVRLQDGRQYLDTEPDILFARYGVGSQYWTVVGTVGHHPVPGQNMDNPDFLDGESIRRAEFGRYINRLGGVLGQTGFTDLPQAPGFSLVPWAVYRTLGTPDSDSAALVLQTSRDS